MQIIELNEHIPAQLHRTSLTDEEAILLHSDPRFALEFPNPSNGFTYRLTSAGWVGHMPIGQTTLVRVTPKVPISSIFGMLEVAYQLKSFRFLDGITDVESLDELYTSLASVLAQRVLDRARKGIYRAYVPRAGDLGTVRGRIDIGRNITNLLRGRPRIACRYRELTPDLEENQLLIWTLFVASRMALTRQTVRVQVRQAFRALAGSVSILPKRPDDCIGRFYHRLNNDYEPLHALCRFLLEQGSPSVAPGDHTFIPFHLDMARLFELYVAQWLHANVPAGLEVRAQHHVKLKGDGNLSFQVDLFIRDQKTKVPIAVLDTKYKGAEAPTEADVQQVVAYAVELNTTRAFLVYPSDQTKLITFKVGSIEVSTVTFDLALALSLSGQRFLEQLQIDRIGADQISRVPNS